MEKAPNSTFTPKNFLGHYAKHAFTLSQPEIRMLVQCADQGRFTKNSKKPTQRRPPFSIITNLKPT